MSRSYKKNPYYVQEKDSKRDYRRKVRHNSKLSLKNGRPIKRPGTFWHYKKRWTKKDAELDYEPSARFPTLESWVEYWKRMSLRK